MQTPDRFTNLLNTAPSVLSGQPVLKDCCSDYDIGLPEFAKRARGTVGLVAERLGFRGKVSGPYCLFSLPTGHTIRVDDFSGEFSISHSDGNRITGCGSTAMSTALKTLGA